MRILFLTPRFPERPFQGDQARAYNQLRLLSQDHSITLVSFVDRPIDVKAYEEVAAFCQQVHLVPRSRIRSSANLVAGLTTRLPFQTLLYRSADMMRRVENELGSGHYDLAHAQLLRMAPYLWRRTRVPRVIDLIDALSVNMKLRSRVDRTPLRLAALAESKRLQRYEREICLNYERVLVVSQRDRDAIGYYENVCVNPIGVDEPPPMSAANKRDPLTVVFSGNMFYYPNVDAASYFAHEIMPLVRQQIPGIRFQIVGARPTRAVRQLANDPSVLVTGFVNDIGEYLRTATVAVCPMRTGSGMQFKVIEAMASGTPVVATPLALGGLRVEPGKHLLTGDNPEEIAGQVIHLVRNPGLASHLAKNAWDLVRDRYTWQASVNQLDEIYQDLVSTFHDTETPSSR